MRDGTRMHWMVDVARRAGLVNGTPLVLPADVSVEQAWAETCRICHLSEQDLVHHVARHYGLGVADLDAGDPRTLRLVPEALARRHTVFPLREDDRRLVVATSNPLDLAAEQALEFASGRAAALEIAAPGAVRDALDTRYSPDRAVETLLQTVDGGAADAVQVVEDVGPEVLAAGELDTAPVVRLTNLILQSAIAERASDIHIEPGRAGGAVRFRVDGVLRTQMTMPMAAMNRVVSRIKILGKLDIADRLRPQDGRTRVQVHGRTYDLRISTVPTRESEKAVIRILDPGGAPALSDLGLLAPERERLRQLLGHRDGVVIVTGPTGSGKTTTMYAAIRELSTGRTNIMTVEDPVEYELAGITQIQVEPKRGVNFPSALRAILRQDPDIVFVGEIRDLETAQVAVQAAMTGHLVLATLHTNDAIGVVQRLVDLGLDRASIAGALRGAVAQRLVRRVCERCRGHASGCPACGQTGYRGRLPVNEVLVITPTLTDAIARNASAAELARAAAAQGMRPMEDVARVRVAEGVTTLEEVERVLGESAERRAPSVSEQPVVLLVDDDPVIRTLARAILSKNGFSVAEAGDGPPALEFLAGAPECALVVLDLQMPTTDGITVLRRIRESRATAALPVLFLTGSDDGAAEVEVMDAGADDYIRKPIDPPRFLARVKAAMRRASA